MRLRQALEAPLDSMSTPTAGLFPEFEQLEAFAGSQLEDDFHTILARYALASGELVCTNPLVPQDRQCLLTKVASDIVGEASNLSELELSIESSDSRGRDAEHPYHRP